MKKASCTVIYNPETKQMYNITVNYKGHTIPLLWYNPQENAQPYKYKSFSEMYKTVLNQLKQNNFYVGKYTEFNSKWHDIQWIDINNPYRIEKYSLSFVEG